MADFIFKLLKVLSALCTDARGYRWWSGSKHPIFFPLGPQLETTGPGQVTVSWQPPDGEDQPSAYEVNWRQGEDGDWVSRRLHDKELREVTLEELVDGSYQLTVCCWSDPGRGPRDTIPFALQNGWVDLTRVSPVEWIYHRFHSVRYCTHTPLASSAPQYTTARWYLP